MRDYGSGGGNSNRDADTPARRKDECRCVQPAVEEACWNIAIGLGRDPGPRIQLRLEFSNSHWLSEIVVETGLKRALPVALHCKSR